MEENLNKEEYTRLCNEISKNSEMSFQILIASLTLTGGLIGYIIQNFEKTNSYLFTVPFFITTPALLMLSSQIRSTYRIASYIAIFLEKKEKNLYWENRLCKLRNPAIFKGTPRLRISLIILFSIIIFTCLVCFTVQTKSKDSIFWVVLIICFMINLISLNTYVQASSSKVKKAFEVEWTIVQAAEK